MLTCKLWLINGSLMLRNVTLVGFQMPLKIFRQTATPGTVDNIGLLVFPLDVSPEIVISLCLVLTVGAWEQLEVVHLLDVTGETEGLHGEAADGTHVHLLRLGPVHQLHVPFDTLLKQRLPAHIAGDRVSLDMLEVVLDVLTDHIALLTLGGRPVTLKLVFLHPFIRSTSKITTGAFVNFIRWRSKSSSLDRFFLVFFCSRAMNSFYMVFGCNRYFSYVVTLRTRKSLPIMDSCHVG